MILQNDGEFKSNIVSDTIRETLYINLKNIHASNAKYYLHVLDLSDIYNRYLINIQNSAIKNNLTDSHILEAFKLIVEVTMLVLSNGDESEDYRDTHDILGFIIDDILNRDNIDNVLVNIFSSIYNNEEYDMYISVTNELLDKIRLTNRFTSNIRHKLYSFMPYMWKTFGNEIKLTLLNYEHLNLDYLT